MSEKITINRVENSCDLLTPETHSVGANLQSDSGPCIITFPEHKKDELGNFNAAARAAFEEYLKDKDLTPKKNPNLYSGKILFINPKQENNEDRYGCSDWKVKDGLITSLMYANSKDGNLRILRGMPCSKLTERVKDMYFCHNDDWSKRNKVMYLKDD